MGATRSQLLRKVQLPLARRMILLGVNQTILFALSMVVIAGLIGGGGLGAVVTSGLYSNPALALLAGIVIVVMAIALDRSTEAMAARTDPAHRHLDEQTEAAPPVTRDVGRRSRGATSGLEGVRCQRPLPGRGRRPTPERDVEEWLLAKIQVVLDYVQDPTTWVFAVTERIGIFILQQLLLPMQAVPRRGSVVHDARRADGDRVRRQRAATGADDARDARR